MKFDVTLEVRLHDSEVSVEEIVAALDGAPFHVDVSAGHGAGALVLKCGGVESQGLMALPEALRKAQVGLSRLLREDVPEFADRGLMWSDVVAVDVRTASTE